MKSQIGRGTRARYDPRRRSAGPPASRIDARSARRRAPPSDARDTQPCSSSRRSHAQSRCGRSHPQVAPRRASASKPVCVRRYRAQSAGVSPGAASRALRDTRPSGAPRLTASLSHSARGPWRAVLRPAGEWKPRAEVPAESGQSGPILRHA